MVGLKETGDGVELGARAGQLAVEGVNLDLLIQDDGKQEGALEVDVGEAVQGRAVAARHESGAVEGIARGPGGQLVPEAPVAGLEASVHRRDGIRRVAHEGAIPAAMLETLTRGSLKVHSRTGIGSSAS